MALTVLYNKLLQTEKVVCQDFTFDDVNVKADGQSNLLYTKECALKPFKCVYIWS